MSGMSAATAEESRLAAVRSLGLVDTPPEERFDRITRLAQACIDVPIAFMTLAERDRLYFKSHQGTPLSELLREGSFCDAVVRAGQPLVIEDASRDARYRQHELVAGPAGMRFYAGHPIRTHDGHVVGTLCLLDTRPRSLDATRRSQLESFARLLETELHRESPGRALSQAGAGDHELRRFFSLSLDMLCVAGHDGYFKALNPAWEATLGWSRDELLGRPYLDFVHREDRSRTLQDARLLERGDITVAFENRYRCRDGSYRHLLWSAVAEPAGGRVFAVARDITALRATEEALKRLRAVTEAASRTRGRFLVGLGLELRPSLERVLGLARSLAEAPVLHGDASRPQLEQIQLDAVSLLGTVRELVELADLESGRVRPQVEPVDLARLVETAAARAEAQIRSNGCSIRIEQPTHLAPFPTDGRWLGQALRLLLEAASRTSALGRLVVRVLEEPGSGRPERIVVESGVGPGSYDPRGGEPALAGTEAGLLTGPDAGSGLGLAMARSMCEQLGLRLQVVSRAGLGGTYTIDLV